MPVKKRMLLAEVEPMSSTHSPSPEVEFSNREISAMPLDRRVSLCRTAGPAVCFEELQKNFITLSETSGIDRRSMRPVARWARHFSRRGGPRFSGLFLNIDLPFQERALFNGDALGGQVASYHRRLSQVHAIGGVHAPIQLTLNHHGLGANVGLDVSVRPDRQAVVAQL